MEKSAKIWNRFAQGYAKRSIADMDAYEEKLKITQKYFKPDMEVLEIGCGTGGTARIHSSHVKHILATDFSSSMIEIAKDRAQEEGVKNVTFECATMMSLDIKNESLDVVLALSLLHLLNKKEKQETIEKIYEKLKKGGVFVNNTGCLNDHMPFLKLILPVLFFRGCPS